MTFKDAFMPFRKWELVEQENRSSILRFKFQTKTENIESVGYSTNHKSTIDDAAANKSPVKVNYFKRKFNYRDNSKQDLELGRTTKIKLLSKFDFESKPPTRGPSAAKIDVKDIENAYDGQLVSVVGYIKADECYATKFKKTYKQEVYLNDKKRGLYPTNFMVRSCKLY